MVTKNVISDVLDSVKRLKIEHLKYRTMKRRVSAVLQAMFLGELAVIAGPPRVGKTRSVRDALAISEFPQPDDNELMPVVIVEAANEGTSGEFSTKGFAMACLRAIRHPIFGIGDDNDPWGVKLNERLERTPERRLWSAFEQALILRKTEYFVIDEAHHVRYVRGGDEAAAKVLDSWKCLANIAKVKLVLIGSYKLLPLMSLAPHLLGRQLPLEFARYKSSSMDDIREWEKALRCFSELIPFNDNESLSTWNRYLFEGSMGRIGGLSSWLRGALAKMIAEDADRMTIEFLQASRMPAQQEDMIFEEIVEGEKYLLRQLAPLPIGTEQALELTTNTRVINGSKSRGTPFRRSPKRNGRDGRA